MPQIPIKRAIEKVPGGMMVVPLLLGALITTFFPGTPKLFGSFTGALFTDAAGPATVLVAATVIVTAILVPLATAWTARTFGRPAEAGAEDSVHSDASSGTVPAGTPVGH